MAAASGGFSVSRVIDLTFKMLGADIGLYALLALIFYGAPLFVAQAVSNSAAALTPNASLIVSIGGLWLLTMAATAVLNACVIHVAVRRLNARTASFSEALRTGLGLALPMIGLGLVQGLGIGLGFLLLLVPGIILSVNWSLTGPVRVIEGAPVSGSFGRSTRLTEGYRWTIFGLALLLGVVNGVLDQVVNLIQGMIGPGVIYSSPAGFNVAEAGVLLLSTLFSAVIALLQTVGVSVIYFELRRINEGFGYEALASIFD